MLFLLHTMAHTAQVIANDPDFIGEEGLIIADEQLHEEGYYEEVTNEKGNHLGWVVMEGEKHGNIN